jgi:glycosyltransferase involved in cell wall biosynthesis
MRVLVFAYACEPGIGSEPGAGWIWSRMLARMGEVWVITRESNREAIAAAFDGIPEREVLHFEFVDLPRSTRFWKRGTRGARVYYLLWQVAAFYRARALSRKISFDLTWHLTWANAWLGTLAPLLPGRFVYGPVGGGVGMDWNFIATLGIRGTAFEVARALSRATARVLNPLARLPWRRSELILVQNPETRAWLPARYREKAVVFPHIVLDEQAMEWVGPTHDALTRRALFVGRLLPWKGVVMALQVMVLLPDWTLIVCGDGYDLRRLRRRVHRLELEDRVTFLGWVEPDQVRELMHQKADVLLFPSLHDEGGWVIAEALAAPLPVICLDRGGPPAIGGYGVPCTNFSQTVSALAQAVVAADRDETRDFPFIDSSTDRLRAILRSRFPTLLIPEAEIRPPTVLTPGTDNLDTSDQGLID